MTITQRIRTGLMVVSTTTLACQAGDGSEGDSESSHSGSETEGLADESGTDGDGSSESDGGTDDGSSVEEVPCRFEPSPPLMEGVDYECGDLLVPENRSEEGGRDIRVHFIRFFGSEPGPTATIYLDGGPGSSGAGFAAAIPADAIAAITVAGDFVVLAQRGTSLADPALPCQASLFDDGYATALAGCRDAFTADEIDLAAYTTENNADDIEDLRVALGYEQWTLFGISYGSRLSLEVMRRHPERVRAAIIDGVVPADVDWDTAAMAAFWSAAQGLDAACEADSTCATQFGSFTEDLVAMTTRLDQTPVEVEVNGQLVPLGGELASVLVFNLMYTSISYPVLPLLVHALANGENDRVDMLLPIFLQQGQDVDLALGMHVSVKCNDLFNPPIGPGIDAVIDASGVPEPIAGYARGTAAATLEVCEAWPKPAANPMHAEPVISAIPTLVSSGAFDPITPPAYGDVAVATLSNAEHVVFANSGHGAIIDSECSRGILFGFLADPEAPLDTACSQAIELQFVTSQEEFLSRVDASELQPQPRFRR